MLFHNVVQSTIFTLCAVYFLCRGWIALWTRDHQWPLFFSQHVIHYAFQQHLRFWLAIHIISSSCFYITITLQTTCYLPLQQQQQNSFLLYSTTTTTTTSLNPTPQFTTLQKAKRHRRIGSICLITSSFGCLSSLLSLSWRAPYGTSWAYLSWSMVWAIATIKTYQSAQQRRWLEHQCWAQFLKFTAGLFVLARIFIIALTLYPWPWNEDDNDYQQQKIWAYRWGIYLSGTYLHGLFWKTLLQTYPTKPWKHQIELYLHRVKRRSLHCIQHVYLETTRRKSVQVLKNMIASIDIIHIRKKKYLK
jgi:hypothetical protein